MDYRKLVGPIPAEKRSKIADKLTDIILTSKREGRMPSDLANTILYQWKQNALASELGLIALLKAATLLEPVKTLALLQEFQLNEIAEKIKKALSKTKRYR
jgi:hypothetical protein